MTKPRKKVLIPSIIALTVALLAYIFMFRPQFIMIATGHYRIENYSEDRICELEFSGCGKICDGWVVEGACWEHRTGIYRLLK